MQLKNLVLYILLVFITSGCTKVTSVRHVSGYNKNMIAHKEILVLPMQTEVYTFDIGNCKERKYDTERTEKMIIEIFGKEIAKHVEGLTRIKPHGKISAEESLNLLLSKKDMIPHL
ncbi:hypothetical protein RAS_13030 [Rickettsia asiatica]|uniref:Lipoprotein n=1 Tax=Rickettsia asiatica TaxID=238800 RepID=A0A510GBC1_9RICK|nr:hypothetical protein RAS_13030 [Rickettsia asiatica]